jgi:hypothetical protein
MNHPSSRSDYMVRVCPVGGHQLVNQVWWKILIVIKGHDGGVGVILN